jgi:hypothetical protein
MAEATPEEVKTHAATYTAFSKLVLFAALWVTLVLVSMALGLIAHIGILSLLLGVGGTLVGFAVLG